MRKYAGTWLIPLVCAFLGACGGSGGGGSADVGGSTPVSTPSLTELDGATAALAVASDNITFKPAMVREFLVHLSNGKQDISVEKTKVKKVFWNSGTAGFHIVDAARGTELPYDAANPTFVISGSPAGTLVLGGNFSFLLDDGREITQDTDPKWLIISTSTGVFAERRADGLIYGVPTTLPTPATPKTFVEINTASGHVDIAPVVIGDNMVNLVSSNPVERVLDAGGQVIPGYRLVWNDVGSFYPKRGTLAALLLPKTTVLNATLPLGTGAGMPYLVRPDGSFVPFNTSSNTCVFMVNGVVVVASADGLIHY